MKSCIESRTRSAVKTKPFCFRQKGVFYIPGLTCFRVLLYHSLCNLCKHKEMSNTRDDENKNNILLYVSADGEMEIEGSLEGETVWLSQKQMAELFQKDRKTITEHIGNVFKEGELVENSVCRKSQHTASDGKAYSVNFYNLDVIISVGYRVKSHRGTQFRI